MKREEIIAALTADERLWVGILRVDKGRLLPPDVEAGLESHGLVRRRWDDREECALTRKGRRVAALLRSLEEG